MICPAACTHPKACTACAVLLACRSCSRRSPNAAPDGQCLRCHRPARVALSAHYEPVAASASTPTAPGPLPHVLEPRNASTGTDPVALRLSRRRAARGRLEHPRRAMPVSEATYQRATEDALAEAERVRDELQGELRDATERLARADEEVSEAEGKRDEALGSVTELQELAADDAAALAAWALEAGAEAWAVIPRLSGGAARVVQLQALGVTPAGSAVEAAALFGGAA